MKLYGITHDLVRDYFFKPTKKTKQIKNRHPLGTVYLDEGGHNGHLRSGFDWLRFDIKHLDKIERRGKKEDERDVVEETQRQNTLTYLRKLLPQGATVYTVRCTTTRLLHQVVKVLVLQKGKICDISSAVSDALDYKWDGRGAVHCSTAYDLVQRLDSALYGYGRDHHLKHEGL
jgi:hypothetical protein